MFAVEAASVTQASSGPWWVSAILVPFAIAVLSVIGTLLVQSWRERQSRSRRWEPYGHLLWPEQAKLYWTVCEAADEALAAARRYVYNDRKKSKAANSQELIRGYSTKRESLRMHALKGKIFLSDDFNAAVDKFEHTLFLFATEDRTDSEGAQRFLKQQQDLPRLYEELVDSARRGLEVRQLNAASREAIRNAVKERLQESNAPSSETANPGP